MKQFKVNNPNLKEVVVEMVKRKDLTTIQFDDENIGFSFYGLDVEMLQLQLALDIKEIDYDIVI